MARSIHTTRKDVRLEPDPKRKAKLERALEKKRQLKRDALAKRRIPDELPPPTPEDALEDDAQAQDDS